MTERCLPAIVAANDVREQIRVQAYLFSSRQNIAALVCAKARRVKVAMILDRAAEDGGCCRAAADWGAALDRRCAGRGGEEDRQ